MGSPKTWLALSRSAKNVRNFILVKVLDIGGRREERMYHIPESQSENK